MRITKSVSTKHKSTSLILMNESYLTAQIHPFEHLNQNYKWSRFDQIWKNNQFPPGAPQHSFIPHPPTKSILT